MAQRGDIELLRGTSGRKLHHVLHADRGDQLARRSQRDHFAVIHDGDAVAQPLGFVHVVSGQQNRPAGEFERSIRSHSWRRACGSRPVVGSSRNRKSGSPTSAQASASRCFCPPESSPTRAFRFSPSCTMRDHFGRLRPLLEEAAEQPDGLRDGELLGKLRLLQLNSEPLPQLARRLYPSAFRAPRLRRNRPRSGLRRFRWWWSCPRRWARAGRSTRPRALPGRGHRRRRRLYTSCGDCAGAERALSQGKTPRKAHHQYRVHNSGGSKAFTARLTVSSLVKGVYLSLRSSIPKHGAIGDVGLLPVDLLQLPLFDPIVSVASLQRVVKPRGNPAIELGLRHDMYEL